MLALALAAALTAATAPAQTAPVVVVQVRGAIQPGSVKYLERGLREAERRHAALVVFELDTPGGLLVSLRQMTTDVTSSPRPVAVFVAPAGARAASAGFFLLLAADVAAMAPGTNTGAAHPVAVGGSPKGEEPGLAKASEDAAALARALAAQRGRPVDAAEAAVKKSRAYSAQEALDRGLIDVVADDRVQLLAKLD